MSSAIVYSIADAKAGNISALDFSVMSSDEVEAAAVTECTTSTLYARGEEKQNGLMDSAMGTLDRRLLCRTCGGDCHTCPGHTAVINLPIPVYHVLYLETIVKVLRMTCFFCSRLRAPPATSRNTTEAAQQRTKATFAANLTKCKAAKVCCHCGACLPDYTQGDTLEEVQIRWKAGAKFASEAEEAFARGPFDVFTVASILTHISDGDAAAMGFNVELCHPRNFILWNLLVSSLTIRPSVMMSEGSRKRGQDDLTSRLQDIIKRSGALRELCEAEGFDHCRTEDTVRPAASLMSPAVQDAWGALFRDIAHYMHAGARVRSTPTQRRSSLRLKSIMCKLKGKEGRIRGNLMGKRVNFCARSVITPDACLDVNQLGVPRSVACALTIGERVNALNMAALSECVRRGCAPGGAETIITEKGSVYELAFCPDRDKIRLQHGWVVERFLRDGDYVLFNRQPSLHRNSIMGHEVRIMDGLTFHMNLCCSSPYNADFDGDEMNMHVPQNPMVAAEIREVMDVGKRVVSPKANKPVMGIVQDSLLGAHLMSLADTFVTRRRAMALLMCAAHPRHAELPPPAVRSPAPLWTGKQLLQLVLPPVHAGAVRRGDVAALNRDTLLMRGGVFLRGTLDKSNLGATGGSLVHLCLTDIGEEATMDFMSDIQRVANSWLLDYGFSVGIGDCAVPDDCDRAMRSNIDAALGHVDAIYDEFPSGEVGGVVEATVSEIASKVTMQVGGHIRKIMTHRNAMMAMISAGSKGNPINLSQIMGCVGQNCVNGKRIAKSPAECRVLPCYPRGDLSVDGRGFVSNSYLLGLQPSEYFFHAMGGREGLVDTAVKTAVTGYLQRRMIKSGESKRVGADRSVREANDHVVEFLYGGDGMDATRVMRVDIGEYALGDGALRARCALAGAEALAGEDRAALQSEFAGILAARDRVRYARVLEHRKAPRSARLPCDVGRMLHALARARPKPRRLSALTPAAVARTVEALAARCAAQVPGHGIASFMFHVRFKLRSACVIYEHRLDQLELDRLAEAVWERFSTALCDSGEMVGCIAAQSIGETCTQMTLNTFHLAGVLQSVTMGIPRFKELIDLSKNIRTPTMRVAIAPSHSASEEQRRRCAQDVEHLSLADIAGQRSVVSPSELRASALWPTHAIFADHPAAPDRGDAIRIGVGMEKCIEKNVTPCEIGLAIESAGARTVECMWADVNSAAWEVFVLVRDLEGALRAFDVEEGIDNPGVRSALGRRIVERVDVRGIAAVKSASASSATVDAVCAESGALRDSSVGFIDTIGSDLYAVQAYPWAQWCRTTCNDVNETLRVLGIEAAIAVLFHEIQSTVSHDGSSIDPRHIMSIVNTMSYRGRIIPLSRHGINRTNNGVLVRSSFEETGDVIRDAAMFGERDDVNGVSQSIMLGKLANIGTGGFRVSASSAVRREGVIRVTKTRPRNRRVSPSCTKVCLVGGFSAPGTQAGKCMERPFVLSGSAEQEGDSLLAHADCDMEPPFFSERTADADPEGFAGGLSGFPQMSEGTDRVVSGYVPTSPKVCKWK